ncbi:MAG: zinc-dependent peptidase, partial [Pseudomonadota bacterium]
AFLLYRSVARRRERGRLLETPLTPEQRQIVARLVPIVRRLPAHLRPKLEGKINLFLNQVMFRGQNGLEINEAMRLSIAAQACLLIVNSSVWYDTIRNVLVYPSTFRTRRPMTHDGLIYQEKDVAMAGRSIAACT